MRCPLCLLLVAAAISGAALAGDPIDSDLCRQARAELDAALNGPRGTAQGASRLARARSEAASSCLGAVRPGPQRERAGAPEPAQAVAPPRIMAAPATPAPPPAPPLPAPADRPVHVTHCDPAGCWDSEGRRLNQLGPLLMGPRGLCNLQGGIVNCP